MTKKVLNTMFENLLHIGNKSNYWNPKMKSYIYGSVNGVHVINLTHTVKKIEEVKAELAELASQGKKILFVATKLQARDSFVDLAESTGHYYVTEKWVPGLLTNFKTIRKRINTYLQLLQDSENGAFDVLTKKEKAAKLLKLEKLDKAFKGLKEMKKVPEVVVAVDGIYEKQAIKEANSLNLSAFAILNTNGDDTVLTNCIPANTNAVTSVAYIAGELKAALASVKVKAPVKKSAAAKKAPAKKAVVKKVETKTEAKVEAKAEPKAKKTTKTEEK